MIIETSNFLKFMRMKHKVFYLKQIILII